MERTDMMDGEEAVGANLPARILIFSHRNIFPGDLWRCPHYEFEDIICEIDRADIWAPRRLPSFSLRSRVAHRLMSHFSIPSNPGISRIQIAKNYDMFFAICSSSSDLLEVTFDTTWKDWCRTSACLIDEIWLTQVKAEEKYLLLLRHFDHVMLYYSGSVSTVNRLTGVPTRYLPPGVDVIQFCPYPNSPHRVVDVYSYGRRSAKTHQKLLAMAETGGIFYVYDTTVGGQVIRSHEHRSLLRNIAQRSRFVIVNPGLIDMPHVRGSQIEIGNRYFEGAAAGAIMIGETPVNSEFSKLFGPNAVVHLPYDSDDIDVVIRDLDNDPLRQDQIRRTNMTESLLRHDWTYRWEIILEVAGLDPCEKLFRRKLRLQRLAERTQQQAMSSEMP
jgi:hypothetical protein